MGSANYLSKKSQTMQLLTEKFKSNILAKIAPQHGGIAMWINGGKRKGPKVWYRDKKVDLSTITDDMLIGEPFVYDDVYTNGRVNGKLTPEAYEKVSNVVLFNDGYAIQLKPYRLHKQDGTEEPHDPKEKPSKYGTGIGDTGDHVHYDSDGDSKKQTQFYNPYAISPDAGYGNSLRNAYKNNKGERDELQAQLNQLDNNTENTFQRNALKKRIKNAESDMEDNKKNAAQTVKNHDRASQVKPIALNESDVTYIVTEAARIILNKLGLNNN